MIALSAAVAGRLAVLAAALLGLAVLLAAGWLGWLPGDDGPADTAGTSAVPLSRPPMPPVGDGSG